MSEAPPDYSKYSVAELEDALRHVDHSAFADRVDLIRSELRKRHGAVDACARVRRSEKSPSALWARRGVGIYLTGSGGYSTALVLDGIGADANPLAVLVFLPYLAMAIAGLLILKRYRIGLWVGVASLALQIPIFQNSSVAYEVLAAPYVAVRLFPPVEIFFGWAPSLKVAWGGSGQPLFVGLNVGAAALGGAITHYIDRRWLAASRLRRRLDRPV